jgi:hypothetical protein
VDNVTEHNAVQALGEIMLKAMAFDGIQEVHMPVEHYTASRIYVRKITVPAGTVVVTKKHRKDHITIAIAGCCTVVDEKGQTTDVRAPCIWVTPVGRQRSVLCHTEVIWATAHSVPDGLTVSEIEELLAEDTFMETRALIEQEASAKAVEQA